MPRRARVFIGFNEGRDWRVAAARDGFVPSPLRRSDGSLDQMMNYHKQKRRHPGLLTCIQTLRVDVILAQRVHHLDLFEEQRPPYDAAIELDVVEAGRFVVSCHDAILVVVV